MGKFWKIYVKECSAVVQNTRETSARTADPAAAVLKAEISLQQAQMEVPHHVWGLLLEQQEKEHCITKRG